MAAVKALRIRDVLGGEVAELAQRVGPWRGVLLVLHAWTIIATCMVLAGLVHPAFAVLLVPIVGGRQLGLAILMHDAGHGLLSNNRQRNDFVGRWIAGAPIGADLLSYRTYHFRHHKFTQQDEDPDLVLSRPFPVSRASLLRKVMRDLSGLTFVKQKALLIAGAFTETDNRARGAFRRTLMGWLLTNGSISAATMLSLGWPALTLWWLAQVTWLPLSLHIRNIAEHACTTTSADPFSHARTTRASFLERVLIAPYWVNYHAEHHLFMGVPCYRLPVVHEVLGAKGYHDRMIIAASYAKVIRSVVASPSTQPN